jgi:hypothetical protein
MIRKQQGDMRNEWVRYLEMYSAGNTVGLGRSTAQSYYYATEAFDGSADIRFNLAASVVDTAHSLISQAPVLPVYQTIDGDFSLQRKAEKASQVLQGQVNVTVREELKRAMLDALKVGTGFVAETFDPITGLPGVERVSPFEIYVEHLDGQYQKPRTMHRARPIPREVLVEKYPSLETEIDNCPGVRQSAHAEIALQGLVGSASLSEFCWVVESWHLRPGPKGEGRHVLSIENATLEDNEWTRDEFPVASFRYRERDLGYYGAGLIEAVRQNQARINKLIRRIDRAQDLASNVVILNPNGEGSVSADSITNDVGLVINYLPANGPPQVVKWDGTLSDLQAQVGLEFERALTQEGISQSQTNGQGAGKGLDSGAAVRAADDVQSRRLVPYVSRYQMSCMTVARLFEAMNDMMADQDPSYVPVAEGSGSRRNFLRTSQWKKVRPPKDDARLTMSTMSALPTTPQGKWAAVQEWIQAGFVSRSWAQSLLDFPDLDSYASNELAHMELAKFQIESILDGGEIVSPDPRQDLALLADMMTKAKFQSQVMGADEATLQAFEDYLVYVDDLIAQAAPPPPPPPPPAPPMPPAPGLDPMTGLPTQVLAPGMAPM